MINQTRLSLFNQLILNPILQPPNQNHLQTIDDLKIIFSWVFFVSVQIW